MSDRDLVKFTIVDGQVTEVFEFDDGRWERERIDHDESYSIDGDTILKTEFDDGFLKTVSFIDINGDGVFIEGSRSFSSSTSPEYVYDYSEYHHNETETETEEYEQSEYSESNDHLEHEQVGEHFNDADEILDVYEAHSEPSESYESSTTEGLELGHEDIYDYSNFGEIHDELTESDDDLDDLSPNVLEAGHSDDLLAVSEPVVSPVLNLSAMNVGSHEDDNEIVLEHHTDTQGHEGRDLFVMRGLVDTKIIDFDADQGDRLIFDTGFGLTGTDEIAQFVSHFSYDAEQRSLFVEFSGFASLEIVGIAEHQVGWQIVDVIS